jgi:hypothetical protein
LGTKDALLGQPLFRLEWGQLGLSLVHSKLGAKDAVLGQPLFRLEWGHLGLFWVHSLAETISWKKWLLNSHSLFRKIPWKGQSCHSLYLD